MLRKYSPMGILEHRSGVQMLSVDGQWIMAEMLRRTREMIAQPEIPVIQN